MRLTCTVVKCGQLKKYVDVHTRIRKELNASQVCHDQLGNTTL